MLDATLENMRGQPSKWATQLQGCQNNIQKTFATTNIMNLLVWFYYVMMCHTDMIATLHAKYLLHSNCNQACHNTALHRIVHRIAQSYLHGLRLHASIYCTPTVIKHGITHHCINLYIALRNHIYRAAPTVIKHGWTLCKRTSSLTNYICKQTDRICVLLPNFWRMAALWSVWYNMT